MLVRYNAIYWRIVFIRTYKFSSFHTSAHMWRFTYAPFLFVSCTFEYGGFVNIHYCAQWCRSLYVRTTVPWKALKALIWANENANLLIYMEELFSECLFNKHEKSTVLNIKFDFMSNERNWIDINFESLLNWIFRNSKKLAIIQNETIIPGTSISEDKSELKWNSLE